MAGAADSKISLSLLNRIVIVRFEFESNLEASKVPTSDHGENTVQAVPAAAQDLYCSPDYYAILLMPSLTLLLQSFL